MATAGLATCNMAFKLPMLPQNIPAYLAWRQSHMQRQPAYRPALFRCISLFAANCITFWLAMPWLPAAGCSGNCYARRQTYHCNAASLPVALPDGAAGPYRACRNRHVAAASLCWRSPVATGLRHDRCCRALYFYWFIPVAYLATGNATHTMMPVTDRCSLSTGTLLFVHTISPRRLPPVMLHSNFLFPFSPPGHTRLTFHSACRGFRTQ